MATVADNDGKNLPDPSKVYEQLCQSYRAIDDFRAKLLEFLPLVSGGGIFLLLSNPLRKEYMGPVGAFGALITLGLFVYELYGIEKCTALIKAGRDLESLLNLEGQFLSRPTGLLQRTGFLSHISEPFAAGIIYPVVLAAWIYLAFLFTWPSVAPLISIFVFVLGFRITYKYFSALPGVYKF
jgi:hypothetical protein